MRHYHCRQWGETGMGKTDPLSEKKNTLHARHPNILGDMHKHGTSIPRDPSHTIFECLRARPPSFKRFFLLVFLGLAYVANTELRTHYTAAVSGRSVVHLR